MPNILLSTKCMGNCPFCFAKKNDFLKSDKEMMTLDDVEKLIPFCRGERIQIFGGEPTLNPEIIDIIDLLQLNNFPINILTNLMGEKEVYEEMIKRRGLGYLINIHGSEYCDDDELKDKFLENIELFKCNKMAVSFGCTVYSKDQDFSYLYKLIEDSKKSGLIYHLRISPSVPTQSNEFMMPSEEIGDKMLELVESVHKINPKILLQMDCSCFNYCMASEETYKRLKGSIRDLDFSHRCDMRPIEIFPDFSALYCYCLKDIEELRVDNIFDFKNIHDLMDYFESKTHLFESEISTQCDYANCDKLECKGPCLAFNYFFLNNKGKKKRKKNS